MSEAEDWRRRKAEEMGLIQTGPAPSRRPLATPSVPADRRHDAAAPTVPAYVAPPVSTLTTRDTTARTVTWLAVMAGIGLAMLFGWWLRGAATPVDIGRGIAIVDRPAPVAAAPADITPTPVTPAPVTPAPAPAPAAVTPRLLRTTLPRAPASAPRVVRPSFHCKGDMPAVNRMICDSRRLLALDVRMSAAYGRAVTTAGNNGRRRIEAAQTRFLNRRAQCDTAACLDRVYRRRIAELGQRP